MTRLFLTSIFSIFFSIVQAQAPVANFSMSTTSGCAPLNVRFTSTSTGNPTEFYWSFSNGVFSEQENPSVTFSQPGTYDVHLVVRNANGTDERILTQAIVVDASPRVGFEAATTLTCLPSNIQFTDTSRPHPDGGNITRWEWQFSNGVVSNDRNPQVNFTEPGFYSASLRVFSENNCSAVANKNNYIRILNGITPSFRHSDPLNCNPPFQLQFTDQTIAPGNLTYTWDFGNGQTYSDNNPTHSFTEGGSHNVRLSVNSSYGCSATLDTVININYTETDFTIPDNICINTPVTFINQPGSNIVSTQWDFGNGTTSLDQNGTTTFTTPGVYQVRLNNQYDNCLSEITKTVTVSAPPSFDFTASDLTNCQAPFTTNFTASVAGASYLWDFGDGNTSTAAAPSHTYQTPGNYTVSLRMTNENGCATTITKNQYINIQTPTLQVSGLPQGLCVNGNINASAVANSIDGIANINWELVGISTQTGNSFSHNFTAVGSYPINITATTNNGCEVSRQSTILVGTPPTPIITNAPDTLCPSDQFTLMGDVAPPHNSGITYSWSINDVIASGQQVPMFYNDTGNIIIELTAFHNFCPSTTPATHSVYINRPIAAFDETYDCTQKGFNFINNSLVRTTDNATYLWNFGPNANIPSSTERVPPLIRFNQPGEYEISLTVTVDDCSHTFRKTIREFTETAQISMTSPNLCLNQNTTFTALGNANNIAKYEWSINNGPFVEGERTITHVFTEGTAPSVRLRITDIHDCVSETELTDFEVFQPISRFTPSVESGCQGLSVSFTNESTSANSEIVRYRWNFGDGSTSEERDPTHLYLNTGNYKVRLTVFDDKSCSNTYEYTGTVRISGLQSAFDAASEIVCPDVPLQFNSTTLGNNLTYTWNFGGNGTSTEANPVHTFDNSQENYLVRLTVRDEIGCESTTEKNIEVKLPTVKIDAVNRHSICIPLETSFQQTAENYRNLLWTFGDEKSSTLENPSHFYNEYGVYNAKLTAEGYGCSVSDSISVVLTDIDDTELRYSIQNKPDLNACVNDIGIFEGVVTPGTSWYWNVENERYDTILNFEHLFRNYGNPVPSIVLTDSTGCTRTKRGDRAINILGSRVIFDLDEDQFCDHGIVTFRDFSLTSSRDVLLRHVWDFGDNSPQVEGKSVSHEYTAPGTYIVQKYVHTNSCVNVTTDTVRVYNTPEPTITSEDFVCVNNTLQFAGNLIQQDTAITWRWNINSTARGDQQNYSQAFTEPGNVNIRLIASTENNCVGEATKDIEVIPLPQINFEANPLTLILGNEATLPAIYDKDNLSYTWSPNVNLSCADCANPITNTKRDIDYKVFVQDQWGCQHSESISVKVICTNENIFIPNTFTPNGDGKNDVFFVRGKALTMVKSFKIFNRWGQIVYQKMNIPVNDASVGWNGTFNGKLASPDVYIYTVEIICDNGAVIPFTGNITLLR